MIPTYVFPTITICLIIVLLVLHRTKITLKTNYTTLLNEANNELSKKEEILNSEKIKNEDLNNLLNEKNSTLEQHETLIFILKMHQNSNMNYIKNSAIEGLIELMEEKNFLKLAYLK